MRATLRLQTRVWLSVLLLSVLSFSFGQEGNAANGFKLFDKNCTTCHKAEAKENVFIGPGLLNVAQRLQDEEGLGIEWIRAWIKDNNALRESGDAYANKVYDEYNQQVMNTFPNFSDGDIDDILAYLVDPPAGEKAYIESLPKPKPRTPKKQDGMSTGIVIVGFLVLGFLLLWILVRLNALVKLSQVDELLPEDQERIEDFSGVFEKYSKFIQLGMAALTGLAVYGLWIFLLGIGVDKGYEPEQPIYFSHKVHNGIQGIDCQYCHSSAKYGKVSGIPSANTCMNCHKSIDEFTGESEESQAYLAELVDAGLYESEDAAKAFYTEQIHKMYDAIGWDKDAQDYTGKQKPIKWIRIHNMPDFVFFPHAQHVVAGENAILKAMDEGTIPNAKELNVSGNDPVCFACHGNVGEMDEVKMANQFTMGWCIECHRTTEVDMENEYNKEYYSDLHDKLKAEYGENATITVDAIGGLECGKCHY